jgi:hypothetical protein
MMAKSSVKLFLVAALGLLLAVPAWGQPLGRGGGPGMGLDMSKLETLTGTVEGVNRITPPNPQIPPRLEVRLKTAKGTVSVFLGPADYAEQQGMKLATGDQVQIKAVPVNFPQHSGLAAVEVQKGGQVLRLRDEAGRPLWPRPKRVAR